MSSAWYSRLTHRLAALKPVTYEAVASYLQKFVFRHSTLSLVAALAVRAVFHTEVS